MDNTPNLALPLLANKQALQTTFHDEALKKIDALVMLSVIDRDLSSPPATPSDGDRYLVKAPGSGDPAWLDDRIVVYLDDNWMALAPRVGWTCYIEDEGALIVWDGTAWQPALDVLGGGAANNLALLGVGTTADAVNPFSAKLNNALWVARTAAEGGDGDLRYKMSKEGAANTLSVLFQDNFSGRAEIGLTGDDDFHFKVSPDGSAWIDAIVIDKDTGAVAFPNTPARIARPGDIMWCFDSAPPDDCVELDGSTITDGAIDFPAVASRYSWMVSGDDLILPDARGRFPRIWAHGSSNDPDRAGRTASVSGGPTGDNPGTLQNGQFQQHVHGPGIGSGFVYYGGSGAPQGAGTNNWQGVTNTGNATSGAGANETRPTNINFSAFMLLG